jgi:hypothetical protein
VSPAPGDRYAQAIPLGGPLPGDPPALRNWLLSVTGDRGDNGVGLPEDWPTGPAP